MRQKTPPLLTSEQRSAIALGLAEMRRGEFFRAHECFEELFRSESPRVPAASNDTRTLLHALAQLAASHHQLTLGRARAAVRTWHKAKHKLAQVGALADELSSAMESFHARLQIDAVQPRFLDTRTLGSTQSFPVPALDTLHSPSA
jgi:hypothetical protein